jgi:hypothetical protein
MMLISDRRARHNEKHEEVSFLVLHPFSSEAG